MNENVIRKCLEICSVPWLCSIDLPWFDFTPTEYQQPKLIKLYNAIKSCLNADIIGKCLKVLSFIGGRVHCPTWLIHIMRNALVSGDTYLYLLSLQYYFV